MKILNKLFLLTFILIIFSSFILAVNYEYVTETITVQTINYTWYVPANVTEITVELQGGGASGGGCALNANRGGGGGGGGSYIRANLSVTPGDVWTVNVASLAAGATAGDNNGITGINTTFNRTDSKYNITLIATGGNGGSKATIGTGGTGGVPVIFSNITLSNVSYNGGNGAANSSTFRGGGGGGGASGLGIGSNAVTTTGGYGNSTTGGIAGGGASTDGTGTQGTSYGAGSGGAACDTSSTARATTGGTVGILKISYYKPVVDLIPFIVDSAETRSYVSTTSRAVNLPKNFTTDDLLLMIVSSDGIPTISTTNWTKLYEERNNSATTPTQSAFYRYVNSTINASTVILVATNISEEIVAKIYVIRNANIPYANSNSTSVTSANPILQPINIYNNSLIFGTSSLDITVGQTYGLKPPSFYYWDSIITAGTTAGATQEIAINKYLTYQNINKAFLVNTKDTTSPDSQMQGVVLSYDGTKMYMSGGSTSRIYQFNLSTPYNVTTAVLHGSKNIADSDIAGLYLKKDGTKLYTVSTTSENVAQYNFGTAFDINTLTHSSSVSIATNSKSPEGITFGRNESVMYITGVTGNTINQYELSVPGSVSSAVYMRNITTVGIDNNPEGLFIEEDGTIMYLSGSTNLRIYKLILYKPWDISSAVNSENLILNFVPRGVYMHSANNMSKLYVNGLLNVSMYTFNSSVNYTKVSEIWTASSETWATATIVVPYRAPLDTTPSLTWSQNTTTTPTINTAVTHSVFWNTANNGTLAGYTFSWCNGTETNCISNFINDSYVALGGTANWTNVSKTLNSTPGLEYRWRVFVNTTGGYSNVTDIFTYTSINVVTDTCTYTSGTWYININDNCTLGTQTINAPIVVNGSNGLLTINGNVLCKNLSFVPSTFNSNFIVRVLTGNTFGTFK